jgi:hypothetical protein
VTKEVDDVNVDAAVPAKSGKTKKTAYEFFQEMRMLGTTAPS